MEVLEDTRTGNPRVIVQLAHFSVKEYLVSSRIQKGRAKHYSIQEVDANAIIAEDCLAYLLQFDEPDSVTTNSVLEFPLAYYAAIYWTKHARVVETHSTLAPPLSLELLLTKRHGLLNWMRLRDLKDSWEGSDMTKELYNICPLYHASRFPKTRGFDDICPPLYYASFAGLIRSVKSILDTGADIDAQGGHVEKAPGHVGNALQAASLKGHVQVAQMLLDHGANINAQGGFFGNALQTASLHSHVQKVQLLLDRGADINARGGYYGGALQAASIDGRIQVVQMLLDRGADVNAQGGTVYSNALQGAIFTARAQTVQILLDRGADVNTLGEWDRDRLCAGLREGRYYLRGADVQHS